MKYSELVTFHVPPGTKAAVRTAATARNIKPADWYRSAIALSLSVDLALDTEQDNTK